MKSWRRYTIRTLLAATAVLASLLVATQGIWRSALHRRTVVAALARDGCSFQISDSRRERGFPPPDGFTIIVESGRLSPASARRIAAWRDVISLIALEVVEVPEESDRSLRQRFEFVYTFPGGSKVYMTWSMGPLWEGDRILP